MSNMEGKSFQRAIESIIQNEKVNAAYAVMTTRDEIISTFRNLEEPAIKERLDNIREISERLIGILGGISPRIDLGEEPVIVVTESITPTELMEMDKEKILAIVTHHGRPAGRQEGPRHGAEENRGIPLMPERQHLFDIRRYDAALRPPAVIRQQILRRQFRPRDGPQRRTRRDAPAAAVQIHADAPRHRAGREALPRAARRRLQETRGQRVVPSSSVVLFPALS